MLVWCTGCEGVAAINTITSVMGINLDTLRPEPCVEGHSTPGGYSSKAVKPIALAKVLKRGLKGGLKGNVSTPPRAATPTRPSSPSRWPRCRKRGLRGAEGAREAALKGGKVLQRGRCRSALRRPRCCRGA